MILEEYIHIKLGYKFRKYWCQVKGEYYRFQEPWSTTWCTLQSGDIILKELLLGLKCGTIVPETSTTKVLYGSKV